MARARDGLGTLSIKGARQAASLAHLASWHQDGSEILGFLVHPMHRVRRSMSAFGGKADIPDVLSNVCF